MYIPEDNYPKKITTRSLRQLVPNKFQQHPLRALLIQNYKSKSILTYYLFQNNFYTNTFQTNFSTFAKIRFINSEVNAKIVMYLPRDKRIGLCLLIFTQQYLLQYANCQHLQPNGNIFTHMENLPAISRMSPTKFPTAMPSLQPSVEPSLQPSSEPSSMPSLKPTTQPSNQPSSNPSSRPSSRPSLKPSSQPSSRPSSRPSSKPSSQPSSKPSSRPSSKPSKSPSARPTISSRPSSKPSATPTARPTVSMRPSSHPSERPTRFPSNKPSQSPSLAPSISHQPSASMVPSAFPSRAQQWWVYTVLCWIETFVTAVFRLIFWFLYVR